MGRYNKTDRIILSFLLNAAPRYVSERAIKRGMGLWFVPSTRIIRMINDDLICWSEVPQPPEGVERVLCLTQKGVETARNLLFTGSKLW